MNNTIKLTVIENYTLWGKDTVKVVIFIVTIYDSLYHVIFTLLGVLLAYDLSLGIWKSFSIMFSQLTVISANNQNYLLLPNTEKLEEQIFSTQTTTLE